MSGWFQHFYSGIQHLKNEYWFLAVTSQQLLNHTTDYNRHFPSTIDDRTSVTFLFGLTRYNAIRIYKSRLMIIYHLKENLPKL